MELRITGLNGLLIGRIRSESRNVRQDYWGFDWGRRDAKVTETSLLTTTKLIEIVSITLQTEVLLEGKNSERA
jgi:hypothetical protein